MARLTKEAWEQVRAARETGTSFHALAKEYGVSHQAIQKRAAKEQWTDGSDVQAEIRQRAVAKVAGVVAVDATKKSAEIDAAAEKIADTILKHRAELEEHRRLFPLEAILEDFTKGKSAKISIEMLAIRQKAERTAHGLDERESEEIIIEHRPAPPLQFTFVEPAHRRELEA